MILSINGQTPNQNGINNVKIVITNLFLIFFLMLSNSLYSASYSFKNRLEMKFVEILPGSFYMGSPESEKGRETDEKQHKVKITRGFYMSITEVTQGQWFKLMKKNNAAFSECGSDCPVERVSWNQCKEFIKKLNKYERTKKYRLPTEAEWEYACRAGSKKAFYNGSISITNCGKDPKLDKIGWYCGNSGEVNPVYKLKSHRVARKKPNKWGLYDMLGNVQEWVEDSCEWKDWSGRIGVITDTYVDGIVNPLSRKGDRKIFRGGSWNMSAKYSRSANRSYYRPNASRNNIGFRVVKSK